MWKDVASALFLVLFAGTPARSAEIFYMDHDGFTDKFVGPVGPLVISGEITPGDYDQLLAKIADDPDRFLTKNKIILASTDGDDVEAMKIGKLLKALYTQVSVGRRTGRCVGACFFIFAAAGERFADGEHLLGIAVPLPSAARAFLRENGVPSYLWEKRAPQAPDGVYWLAAEDEARLYIRSPAFGRYLAAKCAWDDKLEREANANIRPFADLTPMWACRARVTQADARAALAAMIQGRSPGP